MFERQFSLTALTAAGLRAAHQVAESGVVFSDPFAARVMGDELTPLIQNCCNAALRPLRMFVALRSRIAEDVARRAISEGARQVVTLGAGLDTFACRVPPVPGLAVYEVDHPATQSEKRRRLAAAGMDAPALRFAPCDFERESLGQALAEAGFDANARTAFLWLGVAPYLTAEAVESTLRFVARIRGGADIVFDYANPPHTVDSAGHRAFHERMAANVAAKGEAFRSYFDTAEMRRLLLSMGFAGVEDVGPRDIAQKFTPNAPSPPENGGHILHAFFRSR
jgi:methyltransferase (TIGR00027 family)